MTSSKQRAPVSIVLMIAAGICTAQSVHNPADMSGMAGMSGSFQVAPSGDIYLYPGMSGMGGMSGMYGMGGMSGMYGMTGGYGMRDFYGARGAPGMGGMSGIPSRFSQPPRGMGGMSGM